MKKYHNIAYYSQYRYYEPTGTATSSLVSLQYNNYNGGTSKYTYTYDILGNITSVSENNVLKLSYEYDSLGQLVRENNAYANKTWKYYYDNAGNITMRDEYAYTTGTLPSSPQSFVFYDYSTGTWGDQLTAYDGTTISYDAIGNPTNWRNALGLMWSGRQLTYMSIDGLDEGLGASYNADGIRTKKTYWDENANQTFHEYVLDGSKIVKETVSGSSSYTMYYYYDAAGSIAGFEYNGSPYYYQKNLQGDIIRICNLGGDTIVQYAYDAWGDILSITGSQASTLGQINPFRYRGYYYDTETGFYYLQTRYYDPEVGRFINADGYISTGQGIIGNNMFAYCGNNPVMHSDPSGMQHIRNFNTYVSDAGSEHIWSDYLPDITDELNDLMDLNYRELKQYINEYGWFKAFVYFISKVKTGGDWDLKSKDFARGSRYLIYDQHIIRYDAPGNINFGYVGSLLCSDSILCTGAGVYQIISGTSELSHWYTCFDDPYDSAMIEFGYYLAKHKYEGW